MLLVCVSFTTEFKSYWSNMNNNTPGRYWTCYQCTDRFYSTEMYTSLVCCKHCKPDEVRNNWSKFYYVYPNFQNLFACYSICLSGQSKKAPGWASQHCKRFRIFFIVIQRTGSKASQVTRTFFFFENLSLQHALDASKMKNKQNPRIYCHLVINLTNICCHFK